MKALTTAVLFMLSAACCFSQTTPPKTLEQFQRYIGNTAASVPASLTALGFKESSPLYTPKGNFTNRYFLPSTKSEDAITVHMMNDKVAGITNHAFSINEYVSFVDALEQKGYVITHQKVQLESANNKRVDIWRSPDMNYKIYIQYAPEVNRAILPYEVTVSNNDMFYGHIESEYTGKLFDPRLTHFSQIYSGESFKGSVVRLLNGQDLPSLNFPFQSIRVSPGMKIIAFDKENFRGDSTVFTADQEEMLYSWRNIKSLKVRLLGTWVWLEGQRTPQRLCFGARADNLKDVVVRVVNDPGLVLNLYSAGLFSGVHTVINFDNDPLPSGKTVSYIVTGGYRVHPSGERRRTAYMERLQNLLDGLKGTRIQTMKDKTAVVSDITVRHNLKLRLMELQITAREGSDKYVITYSFKPNVIRSVTEQNGDPAFRKLLVKNFVWDGYTSIAYSVDGKSKSSNTSSSYSFEMDYPKGFAVATLKKLFDQMALEVW